MGDSISGNMVYEGENTKNTKSVTKAAILIPTIGITLTPVCCNKV